MVDYSRFDHIDSGSDDDTPEPRAHGAATNHKARFTKAISDAKSNDLPNSTLGKEGPRGSTDDVGDRAAGSAGVGDAASFAEPRMLQASKKGKEGRTRFEYQGIFPRNGRRLVSLNIVSRVFHGSGDCVLRNGQEG